MTRGFTLVEAIVAVALLGILASLAIASPQQQRQQLELESGLRRLRVGLDRGRMAAERSGAACGLSLTGQGWELPRSGDLQGCKRAMTSLAELGSSSLLLLSNLPGTVRFTANGLVLDGGLVVLAHPQLWQRVCLVIGLPLGISRTGLYGADPSQQLSSSHCRPAGVS